MGMQVRRILSFKMDTKNLFNTFNTFAFCGVYLKPKLPGFALTLAWTANTIPRPPAKRAASIAIVNAIGNCGNMYVHSSDSSSTSRLIKKDVLTKKKNRIGTFVWRAEWGPSYHNSMYIGLACLVFSSFLAFGTSSPL